MNYKQIYLKFFDYGEQDFIPCERCGSKCVDVHHGIFRSHGGGDSIENLIGVCRECHNKAHTDPVFNAELMRIHKTYLDGYHSFT